MNTLQAIMVLAVVILAVVTAWSLWDMWQSRGEPPVMEEEWKWGGTDE